MSESLTSAEGSDSLYKFSSRLKDLLYVWKTVASKLDCLIAINESKIKQKKLHHDADLCSV